MSVRLWVWTLALLVGAVVGQVLDLGTIQRVKGPQKLGASAGEAVQGAMTQLERQLEKLKEARQKATERLQRVQYSPIDGVIDPAEYVVGPHDVVRVQVWGATALDELVEVTPDGMAVLPGYGAVEVGGLSWGEAKSRLVDAVKRAYNPERFAVTLAAVRVFWAHVCGEVEAPGSYQLGATQRVWDLIQLAGGNTPIADLANVRIYRRGGDTVVVDMSPYIVRGELSANPYVYDGDVVYIPPLDDRYGLVRLYGAGVRSGVYSLRRSESLAEFAKRVGVLSQSAEFSRVQLIRGEEVLSIDLVREDVKLEDGDVIIFPTHVDSIFVGGIVTDGGAYPYYPGLSYQAYVAMAGGPMDKGSVTRVSIYRRGQKLSPKRAGELMPGDVIIVRHDSFYRAKDFIEMLARTVSSGLTIYYLIDRLTQ